MHIKRINLISVSFPEVNTERICENYCFYIGFRCCCLNTSNLDIYALRITTKICSNWTLLDKNLSVCEPFGDLTALREINLNIVLITANLTEQI